MKTPYPSQLAVIEDADSHVLVVAGAGTGKTFTVVQRILWVLGVEIRGRTYPNPVTLDEIAAITYTNQAAKELKEDLREALRAVGRRADAYRVDQARIGTIHGFCAELLRENALRRGVAPAAKVLEEGEALARATQAARDALVEALEGGHVEGLAELLAQWETGRVDRWVVDLMRRPEVLAALERDPGGLDDRERGLVGLTRLALRRLEMRLEREGALDFDRMILWTRDLLRDDEQARHALQRRLRLLVIDEFQDVDPVQKEIAWAIAEPATGRSDTPRLMLVGDPKQSIYRFRRADVTVWNAVEHEFEALATCSVRPLVENFRSVPAILGFVDASIGVLLERPVGAAADEEQADDSDGSVERPGLADFEVSYRPVQATRAPDADPRAVELLVTPPAPDGKAHLADRVRGAEAAAIARRARELNDGGTEWRDMALLLATWGPEPIYTAALRAAGIPVYVLRDEGFFDRREVMDLIVALQVVRDPMDDLALMGFLRSPFVGLRDDSLLHIARHHRQPYWKALREVELPERTEQERLDRALELLWHQVELRDRVPAAELLDSLIRETGFLAHLALLGDDGRQPIANVRRFVGMAREMNTDGAGDLLRGIRERREREDRVGQARLYSASENVLLVTSIHVAKGLEWPVVFWADLGAGKKHITEDLLVGRDTLRLGTPDLDSKHEAADWQDLRTLLGHEQDAERKRLWYVAATRARDRLIITGLARGGAHRGTAAHALFELFPSLESATSAVLEYEGTSGVSHEAVVGTAPVPPELLEVEPAAATTPDDEATPREGQAADAESETEAGVAAASSPEDLVASGRVSDPSTLVLPPEPVPSPVGLTRHSATEFLSHARCPRRHWFKYVLGIREPAFVAAKEQLISAVARGQIVHDVLERYEEEEELDGLLEDAIGRWDENAPPPDSERGLRYREHLTGEITRVLEHPGYAELVARTGARRELSFLHVRPDGAAAQGFIDLAAPDTDGRGLELLDVKTTQCDADVAEHVAGEYAPQRDIYTTSAAAIAGRPVTRFAFQFSHAAVQVGTDLDAMALEHAARRVDERVREIERQAGTAPLTAFPQECGYCGYRRVRLCPGVHTDGRDLDAVLRYLGRDRFRSSFRLGPEDEEQLLRIGLETTLEHARSFISNRLAPARPPNDGRQTPRRGHPVFVAQHATATCCRKCLEQWHGINRGRELTGAEQDHVLRLIRRWLEIQADRTGESAARTKDRSEPPRPAASTSRTPAEQLDIFSADPPAD